MSLTRRSALIGILAAPAIIRTPGLLMPIPHMSARAHRDLMAYYAWINKDLLETIGKVKGMCDIRTFNGIEDGAYLQGFSYVANKT